MAFKAAETGEITLINAPVQDAPVQDVARIFNSYIAFLYRDELYNPESPDRGTAEVHVAKHRAGPNGTDRLAFLASYTRFANMPRGM